MDRKLMAGRWHLSLLLALAFAAPAQLAAQVPVDEHGEPLAAHDDGVYADGGVPIAGAHIEEIFPLTAAELDELVGPVALYPDDLLAIVLPASTYPLEIVQAARFLEQFEIDSTLEPDESWDESVVALLNYPEVLRMLDEQIDWTWRLGEAVISQQADLIAAVESFRDQAYAAGNLESDDYQTVSNNDGVIEIDPVDKEIIYVPYYEPAEVVVYQPQRRVYNYYPEPYPVYYYPYPYGHTFSSGYFWGVTTAFTIGWPNRYLAVHHPSYWGHPYYGHYYYGNYYRHPSISVYNSWYVHNSYSTPHNQHRDGDYWRPRNRSVRNRHYPPGNGDRDRPDLRSNHRTRADTQATNRSPGDRGGAASSRPPAPPPVTANSSRPPSESRDQRSAGHQSGGDRGRGNNNAATGVRPEIRFRDRNDDVSGSRQAIASDPRGRANVQRPPSSQRTVTRPTTNRSASSQRAASRPTTNRQASPQRAVTRPTTNRSASSQRAASRPTTNRQAPAPRATAGTRTQRQAAPRQAAPASTSRPRTTPQRNQSSSRGTPRQRPRQ